MARLGRGQPARAYVLTRRFLAPTKPLTGTLLDDFSSNTIANYGGSFGVSISGGVATLTGGSASLQSSNDSTTSHSLIGSSLFVKWTVPASTAAESQVRFDSGSDADFVRFFWTGGTVTMKSQVAYGGLDSDATLSLAASGTLWVGFAEGTGRATFDSTPGVAGNVYFFTSTDGLSWTLRKTTASVPFFISSGRFVAALSQAGAGTTQTAVIDNLNTTGVKNLAATSSAVASQTSALTKSTLLPKLATLVDDFSSGTLANWPSSYGSPSVVSGQARVPVTSGYPGMVSAPGYDATDSEIFATLTMTATSTQETLFTVQDSTLGTSTGEFFTSVGNLYVRVKNAGVVVGGSPTNLGAYSPTNHARLKIAESGGNFLFSTATASGSWTLGATIAHSWDTNGVTVGVYAGTFGSDTGYVAVDDVNVAPVGSTKDLASTVTATASTTAAIQRDRGEASTVNAAADQTSAIQRDRGLGSTVNASASQTSGIQRNVDLASTSSAVASQTSALAKLINLAATISATASTSADLAKLINLASTVNAVASTSADFDLARQLEGAASGVASTTAAVAADRHLAGTSTATASASASLERSKPLAGTSSAIASISASLSAAWNLSSTANAVASVTAALSDARELASTSSATASTTANVQRATALASSANAVASATAAVSVARLLAATSSATASATGEVTKTGPGMAATTQAFASATGDLVKFAPLAGTASAVASASSTISRDKRLAGTVQATASTSGLMKRARTFAGSSSAVASQTSRVSAARKLAGSSSAVSSFTTAPMTIARKMSGSASAQASTVAAVSAARGIAAHATAVASAQAMYVLLRKMLGSSSGTASVTAGLRKGTGLSGSPHAIASAGGTLELIRVPSDEPDYILELPDGSLVIRVADDFNTFVLPPMEDVTATLSPQEIVLAIPSMEVTL